MISLWGIVLKCNAIVSPQRTTGLIIFLSSFAETKTVQYPFIPGGRHRLIIFPCWLRASAELHNYNIISWFFFYQLVTSCLVCAICWGEKRGETPGEAPGKMMVNIWSVSHRQKPRLFVFVAVCVCVSTVLQAKQLHYIPSASLFGLSLKVLWESEMLFLKDCCHPASHTHMHTHVHVLIQSLRMSLHEDKARREVWDKYLYVF